MFIYDPKYFGLTAIPSHHRNTTGRSQDR